ncbi:MAG TPA: hypothetical protein GX736_01055 [Mogibacterium sp.]|nr:hypothetical protein [Mogibacterium sp.]
MLIQSNMTLLSIVGEYPQTESVFREYDDVVGDCLLCKNLFDTVEFVSKEYPIDEEDLLCKLNEAVEKDVPQDF